jgi:hypothetical protein
MERTQLAKQKSGVFTGAMAVNPVNDEKIPIWVADYVLASYGTGAIMAVPGSDERDFEFATRFGLEIRDCPPGAPIPGSYWGESEAGLVGRGIYVRSDTPVHSLLHEACHFLCMDPARRLALHTDAGGDYAEEDAVCCLQILLAGEVPGLGPDRMMADMDAWGYTFRLGSARAWFEEDAAEARGWLQRHGLTDGAGRPSWSVRRA